MTSPPIFISALFASARCLLTMVSATTEPRPATIGSTPMEAALDALRSRFPNQIVVGFEALWDVRPAREPQIDLGPTNSTLEQVLARIRRENPQVHDRAAPRQSRTCPSGSRHRRSCGA